MDNITGAETCRVHGPCTAEIVLFGGVDLEDRAWRHENVLDLRERHTEQPTHRRFLLLHGTKIPFTQHRESGERSAARHCGWVNVLQPFSKERRIGLGMRDLGPEGGGQRHFPFLG